MTGKFSHSTLGIFRTCPQQFKYTKIDRLKVPRQLYAHNHLGTLVHLQLKSLYQRAADGKLISLDQALEAYAASWEGPSMSRLVVQSDYMKVEDYIEAGRKMLCVYYERYQPFDQGTLLGAEMTLNFKLPNCPYDFTAKIDRLWKRPDGVVEIIDYKTGKRFPNGVNDPDFRHQMGLYELAVRAIYPQFENIEVAQYWLKHDEVLSCRRRPDELDEFAEFFRSEVATITHASRNDDWPTKEGGLCAFCDYQKLCPAKRHHWVLESDGDGPEKIAAEAAAGLADQFIKVDTEFKALKLKHIQLKQDVTEAARDLGVRKLTGATGDVTVTIRTEEKLPTKSKHPEANAELTNLVREEWQFQSCFTLDGSALLKDFYQKGRLSDKQKAQLEEYIIRQEGVTVRAKPSHNDE